MSYVDTVDGRNPANQLRLVVYPIVYRVLPFYPSQVVQDFFHQQYVAIFFHVKKLGVIVPINSHCCLVQLYLGKFSLVQ